MNTYDVTECQPHTAATALLGMRPPGHLGGSPPIKTFRSNLAGKMGPTPLQLDVVGSDVHQPESRFRILQQTHWWELIPFEARAWWTTAPEKSVHCNNPEMKIMRSLEKDCPFGWFWLKRIVIYQYWVDPYPTYEPSHFQAICWSGFVVFWAQKKDTPEPKEKSTCSYRNDTF